MYSLPGSRIKHINRFPGLPIDRDRARATVLKADRALSSCRRRGVGVGSGTLSGVAAVSSTSARVPKDSKQAGPLSEPRI